MKKDRNSLFINWGEHLFKVRSYTPIPLFFIMYFCDWGELEKDAVLWPIGLFLVVVGESARLWALRYIGKYSRTRKRKGRQLITEGPYAFTRNPLYFGNLLILLGATILCELIWLIPIVIILFFLQYHCIVLWEEETLIEYFSQDAECYFQSVPRWFPKRQTIRNYSQIPFKPYYSWANIFHREKRTLQGLLIMLIFIILKELLDQSIFLFVKSFIESIKMS